MKYLVLLLLVLSCSDSTQSTSSQGLPDNIKYMIDLCNEYDKLVGEASDLRQAPVDTCMSEEEKQDYIKAADVTEYAATKISYKYNKMIRRLDKSDRTNYNLRPFLRKVSEAW